MDREHRLIELIEQLHQLSPNVSDDDAEIAGRLTLRSNTGRMVGMDALLCDKALDALTDAVASVVSMARMDREYEAAADDVTTFTIPDDVDPADIDPLLEAEFEEYCIGLDTDFLVQMAAEDPKAAVAAFDEITTDGEL